MRTFLGRGFEESKRKTQRDEWYIEKGVIMIQTDRIKELQSS